MRNLRQFYTTSDIDRKCLRRESRYPKSERHVTENDSLRVRRKKIMWTLVHQPESRTCDFRPIQMELFGRLHFGPYEVCCPHQIFTRATDWRRCLCRRTCGAVRP